MKYLGRYLKRPPVAASQLRHYRGGAVVHQYYDHKTQQHKRQKLTQEEMLQRPGFAVLMKSFLGTNPYKYILCGDRLRFAGAQAGTHATELLSERLQGMSKKQWLRMPALDQCA